MAATPITLRAIRAPGRICAPWRWLAPLLLVLAWLCPPAQAAMPIKGEVSINTSAGYARLIFRMQEEVDAEVRINGSIMIISFREPVDVNVDKLNTEAPDYISASRRDPDGTAIRIALAQKVTANAMPAAERLFLDLMPAEWNGPPPSLPQEVVEELARRAREAEKKLRMQKQVAAQPKQQVIRVKVGIQPTFTRYMFELPDRVGVTTDRSGDRLTLSFDQPIVYDLADAKATMPPTIEAIKSELEHDSVAVSFSFNGPVDVRTFRDDKSIVVDVNTDNSKGAAADVPPVPAEPVPGKLAGIEAPETVPAKAASEPPPAAKKDEPAAARKNEPSPAARKDEKKTESAPKAAAPSKAAPPAPVAAAAPKPAAPEAAPAKGAVEPPPAEKKEEKKAAVEPAPKVVTPVKPAAAPDMPAAKAGVEQPASEKQEEKKVAAVEPAPAAEPAKPAASSLPPIAPGRKLEMLEPAAKTAARAPAAPVEVSPPAPAQPPAPAAPPTPVAAAPAPVSPAAAEAPPALPAEAAAEPAAAEAAEPGKPAAAAASGKDAPVVVRVVRQPENLRLNFPFGSPTPAAVFRRADALWFVFDTDKTIDLSAVSAENRIIRNAAVVHPQAGETIVRLRLERPQLASLAADGPGWVVTIGDTISEATRPLVIGRNLVGANRASITIPFEDPRTVHRVTDPDSGDALVVITALGPARGFLKAQDFVELRTLASAHGVAIQPLADDLRIETSVDKILINRPEGLVLSQAAPGKQPGGYRPEVFDAQLWGFDRQADFNDRQSELIRNAAAAPEAKRRNARIDLARFYLARGMFAEAKGVLDVALAGENSNLDDTTGLVLKSVANVMLDRSDEALKDLANPAVGNQHDAPIWRALAYARQGKWVEAREGFKDIDHTVVTLPIELQRLALMEAMRTSIEAKDFNGADKQFNELETLGVPGELEPKLAVLSGRLAEGLGRGEDALTAYRAAADSRDRPASAAARLRLIELRSSSGELKPADAIGELEALTTAWRGDETEVEALELLAKLYTDANRYRDAFHVMRTALLAHPNSDMTRRIFDEAAATFDSLFLAGRGDAMPAIEALGLFYDFRELTPIGKRGDEMIRRLAERLVSVDLLDQAAELLQHQVDHRLQGAARAQVATKLAIIYLLNRKPDRALATLRSTRSADLSNELRNQRLLIEARALSDIGRHDVALEVISAIEGREAIRLRSDILWAARRWREAAEQIELYYGDRWKDFAPLTELERPDILRAAVGFTLGEDQIGLARFREKYAAKMAETPDRRSFDIVSAPLGTGGSEFREMATAISAVDTLKGFLRELRTRYPDSGALLPATSAAEPPKVSAPETKPTVEAPAMPQKPPTRGAALHLPFSDDRVATGSIGPRTAANGPAVGTFVNVPLPRPAVRWTVQIP
jgi:tetratricopeptide (TPR) repeat protein